MFQTSSFTTNKSYFQKLMKKQITHQIHICVEQSSQIRIIYLAKPPWHTQMLKVCLISGKNSFRESAKTTKRCRQRKRRKRNIRQLNTRQRRKRPKRQRKVRGDFFAYSFFDCEINAIFRYILWKLRKDHVFSFFI